MVTPLVLPAVASCVNDVVSCWFAYNRVLRCIQEASRVELLRII